ncbi:MAG: hypothetical protein AB7U34_02845 [Novosphingobium sp.]
MAKAFALARTRFPDFPVETLHVLIVYGCALALIAAGNALPF